MATTKRGRSSYSDLVLPIVQRGPFFQDTFFEHARFHFDAAIRKLLPAVGEADDQLSNSLERYRRLKRTQTVTESQDGHNNKIVLDVHEFRHGDLRVSAVGETEILVEAVSEVPEHEAKSMQIRKFRQKFLLPDTATATDSIAALSSDGVLAIITPKKDGTIPSIKRKLTEDVETPEKSSKYMTKHDPRSNETEKSTIIDREMVECFLPILQRGNFFTDSIFQETRQDFNTAITEVLDKWGERSVHDPQRGTRREEPKEDNQVMVITDDDHNTRKILVDIADFTLDGEVKINVMDEELVVEGRTKKGEGGATSTKTFIRRFTLAPDIDPSAVTSVVTPDGILEITTPKKAVIPKLKEFSIQVIIELIVEESHTSPRKDSKTRRKLKDKSPAKDTNSSHSRKKKKIPEDGESEDYNNQAAAASYDDNLLNTKNTLKEELYKLNDEKEILQSTEVSELMAQNISITGEDIETGASLEGIKGSLGDNSSVAEGNYNQQIIASRADDNSDESDESQQKLESAEPEPQVHITDIKRFILQATREFGSDDEAQQSKVSDDTDKNTILVSDDTDKSTTLVSDDTDKSTTLESKGESLQEEQFKSGAKLDLENTASEESSIFNIQNLQTATLTEETLSSQPSEDISLKDAVSVDISQSFDSVVDIPSKPYILESEEEVSVKVAVNSSLEDNNLIPIILNGNAQKDNYEVGGDFKKLLFSLPEHLEQQSQESSIEKENVIPSTFENYSKDIGDRYQTNKMDHQNESNVTKNIPGTKQDKLPEAYVTLATNDEYAIGALVLGHSLCSVGTTRKLVVMITEDVSSDIRPMLQDVFNEVIVVNVMDSRDSAHLALLKRPELGVTFTKLHCWTLLQYSKCVFLDADIFAIQNPDDLFGYPELSAAPDIGWPDCFNSGMFVFVPNIWTYNHLLQHSQTTGSFDGGDQGVLNTFFPKWNCISFIFNMVASAVYTYLPAYIKYGTMAKIVHFLGSFKPWNHTFNKKTGEVETAHGYHHLRGFLNSWWKIYTSLVEPGILKITMARQPKIERSPGFGDAQGYARWEWGTPDYLGQDSYMNIQAYIDDQISQNELSNKKKSSKKKTFVSSPVTKKDNDSQNFKVTKTEDVSQEKLTFLSKFSEDLSKKNNEVEKQVQEIIEVPEIIKATEKKEDLKQPPNLQIEKSEKENEDSDWVVMKSRRWRQSEGKSESFEEQQPESTDENGKQSLVSESYLLSKFSQITEVKEEVSPTEEAELLTSEPSLATEKMEDSARFERGAVDKKFSKSKKSKKSQKSSQKYEPFDTSTTEVSSAGKSTLFTDTNQSTPLYSEILSRKIKDSKESSVTSDNTTADNALLNTIQLDTSIPKDQMDDFTPVLETSTVTHDDCVDSEQTFATTVRETAHKIVDMIVDLQTVIEDSELSTISKADATLIQKDVQDSRHQEIKSSKYSDFEIEEAYRPEKQPYWNIKATPNKSKYSSALESKELEVKEIETKTPKSTSSVKSNESIDSSSETDSSVRQDLEQLSLRPKTKTIKESIIADEDLIKASQTHSRKSEDESIYGIDERKIWDMGALRYLGPNEPIITQAVDTIQNNTSTEPQITAECPKVESQTTQESYIHKSSALAKGIKETSSSIEAELMTLGNRDEDESVYSKYSIPSSKKGTIHQKEMSYSVDIPLQKSSETLKGKEDNEPYISKKQKEHSDISYTSRKQEEHSNISSSSVWESSLSDLDKKLDYASNLLNIPSSGIITGTAASDSVDKKLKVGSEVDESAKVYELDVVSPNDKRKIEVHPEDAKKQDKKQQDAKQLQDQTQELMQQAWAPEVSEDNKNKVHPEDAKKQDKKKKDAKQLQDQTQEPMQQAWAPKVSEDNKNKLPSDEAKSLQAQAVPQKESKASDIEGVKEKLTATSECITEVSKASVDKTAKESEGVKPSTKSQPDVQKTDERANEESSQELDKKQIAQDESSKLLSSKAEKNASSKSAADEVKSTTAESSAFGEVKSATEQHETTRAQDKSQKLLSSEAEKDASSKSMSTSAVDEIKSTTAKSSADGEVKSETEQQGPTTTQDKSPKLLSSEAQKDAPSKSKSTSEQELPTAESSVSGEFKSTAEQQELATSESYVTSELKSTTEQQEIGTTESSVAGNLKSATKQQQSSTAEISVAGELKATTDQQELVTSGSSVAGDLKSTTDQQEVITVKNSQTKDESLKTLSPTEISQQKSEELSKSVSEQSALEESVKSELSSIQQVEKEVKSTVQKSVKEESVKVSDGSVKPKKSTVKTDVSEKQSTEIRKSTSTAKLDIQSTSSRGKEEEKNKSTKDTKALFQSQATAASGSTSDLRSTDFGSGLPNTRSKSTSYSTLPGSSSPSSGYLPTGTKSIATGSFTFKTTEEYVKNKPPPRNRPFFNLRDFM